MNVTFLADTGASDVVLTKSDARRLGFDVNRLRFDGSASTANGVTRTASVRLARLEVGRFVILDVPAVINEGELNESLLGMSFLRRFDATLSNGTLTLTGEP